MGRERQAMTIKSKATFAAGCFWGVEAAFRQVGGVLETAVGYVGGSKDHPTYQEVCTGKTGHAEAVRIIFDPDEISYRELLRIFWAIHDPTIKNRQGPDIGTQYRSAIFYHDSAQKEAAHLSRDREDASGRYLDSIVTEIVPVGIFWTAEDYHQQYEEKRRA